jgi:uncharacterized membrane protein YhiD involved in acid resistance
VATSGELAVAEIQDRIANRLKLDVIRIAKPTPISGVSFPGPGTIAFALAGVFSAGSALYALIH